MVLCEIGEYAEREADRADAPLHERVGGDLHHRVGAARVRHLAQQALERQRIRRRPRGGKRGVTDHVPVRADQADLRAEAALEKLL